MNNSILVVDDEIDFLESVRRGLLSASYKNIKLESDPQKALAFFEQGEEFDLVLIDVTMPEMNGITLLETIKGINPNSECLMVTAVNEARIAVECLKKGAYDYLIKPLSKEDLISAVKRALERRKFLEILALSKKDTIPELSSPEAFQSILTRSSRMLRILKEAELHAASDVPVLITGESGTGKELLAKAIHLASPRIQFPFTPINMVSLPGNLFDAEFFGHTRGAFTGAEKDRMGFLEYTHKGTLFLDEIGDLPLEFQGKLLRVLQDGEFIRLGTNKPQKADIRFIAATNQELDELIAKGSFRKDLYYRLKGAWLHLPPLREKKEDIPLLANQFLKEFSKPGENIHLEEDAMVLLMDYGYPGNIRELRALLQSAVNLAQSKNISSRHLPLFLQREKTVDRESFAESGESILSLEDLEKNHILRIFNMTGKNKTQSAKLLGIGLSTLRRKLETYGIE
jgi:DNA-binding NtrC family response regulator